MSQLSDRIAQFRKMTTDDPDNEWGHFKLGQLLAETGDHEGAVESFRRAAELSPQYSSIYPALGRSLLELGRRDEAEQILKQGYGTARGRGDRAAQEEIARLLGQLGEAAPADRSTGESAPEGGFYCHRPGCPVGPRARPLPAPPMSDDLGRRIQESVCADCWQDWLRNYSIKVINELRLDLSSERGQELYDQYMMEFLGLR